MSKALGGPRVALTAAGVAFVLAGLGYLMLRGKDPMQALLFEENFQVLVGLALLLICRLFLLFIAPGWLLYAFLAKKLLSNTGPSPDSP